MADDDRNLIEILGQRIHYPQTWQATIGVTVVTLIVAVTTAVVVWIVMVRASKERVNEIAGFVLKISTFSNSGGLEEEHAGEIVQFWSPSVETCPSIQASYGQVRPDQQWQCIASDAPAVKFGDAMMQQFDPHLNGYRRWKVSGRGRTALKDGFWWVMNVDDRFDIPTFVRFYSQYWKNEKPVYIEEIRGKQGFTPLR